MDDIERQMVAQVEAWNLQEAVLLQQIVTLQAELARERSSHSDNTGNIVPPSQQ